jgi:TonB family protein
MRRRLLVGALLAASGTAAQAQLPDSVRARTSANACLDRIPPSVMRPVPVFLSPNLVGESRPHFELHAAVDPFARAVARTVQALLGANDSLAAAEPAVTWRSLDADVHVVARRDGSVAWRVEPDEAPSEARLDFAGALLVGRAIDSVLARARPAAFAELAGLDSVEWLLQVKPSFHDESGAVTTPKMRAGFPMFSVLMPAHRSPRLDRVPVRYPDLARQAGLTGGVVMLFTIDTTGRVVPSSIRDQRPAEYARLQGSARTAYDRFVGSTTEALAKASYHPARIGGCLATARVRQPFTFALQSGVNGP